jgi:hypothetical protein
MRHRWWYLSGVGFAVALVVGFMMSAGNYPEDAKAPDADWIKVIASKGDRASIIIGAYVLFVAGMLFLWFAASIRTAIRSEEDTSDGVLASVANASAVVFVTLLLVGAVALAAVPASITFGDSTIPGADFARQFSQLGVGALLAPGALAAAVYVASTSRLGAIAGLFSRGVSIVGYVAAVLLLFGALFLPFLALPIWTIVVGIALARRPATATATHTPATSPTPTPTTV